MKERILGFLFADYKRRIDLDAEMQIKAFKASLDIKDVVRERLKGIRPSHPDKNKTWLINEVLSMDTPERLEFLSKAYVIHHSEVFAKIVEYLLSEAQRKATLETNDMEEVNYQRANINALMLLEEELSYYANLYVEEKRAKDLLTFEEQHEAI